MRRRPVLPCPSGTRCHRPTCDGARRPARQCRKVRGGLRLHDRPSGAEAKRADGRRRRETHIPTRADQAGPGWGPRWPNRARGAGNSALRSNSRRDGVAGTPSAAPTSACCRRWPARAGHRRGDPGRAAAGGVEAASSAGAYSSGLDRAAHADADKAPKLRLRVTISIAPPRCLRLPPI